ncbi:hypothetical protein DFH09DRAFT_632095 [Mycena vulgaris]|nr:hypothetical protein DFH09DRAFT_632095 [Mycena vulgaris]
MRGGQSKWTLKHLPEGTVSEFKEEVVPLARELTGTLAPWAKMTSKQLQTLLDKVYGAGKCEGLLDGPFYSLTNYRLYDWRNDIAAQPHKAMLGFIEDAEFDDDDEESDEEENEETAAMDVAHDDVPPAAATTSDDVPPAFVPAVPTPQNFDFKTTGGRAYFVKWCLQTHGPSGTKAFHWKKWGNGVDKKGFLQSNMILHAFSSHLAALDTIPGGYERLEAKPEGALLLAVEAVERELGFWTTGDYVNPGGPANYFSEDNWGDTTTVVQTSQGKKKKLVRRATKYLSSVQKWDDTHWKTVIEDAKQYIELPSRKRGQTASRSGSEAGDDRILSDDDAVMVLSD